MYEDLIAKRLAHLRTAKGVSAREMSLDIGQNGSYINRIENGKSMPSMQGFLYICEYLGVTPKDFFDAEVVEPQAISNLTNLARQLTIEDIEALVSMAKRLARK